MRLFFVHPRWVRMAIFACVASSALAADPGARPEPAGELTLSRAVAAAMAGNPDLVASAFDLRVAEARVDQASVKLNPELSVDLENFAGNGTARGTDALETTLSLSQVIELGDKRRHRTDVALAARDQSGIERQAHELDVLADVARRFIAVVAAQERVQLASTGTELAQRTLDAIAKRVTAARSPEAERSRAQIALTRERLEQEQARSELISARYSLAALWGSREPVFTSAKADLFSLDTVGVFETLAAKLEQNPDFLRFASEARLRDAELRLERAQARPNLTLGIGVRRLGGSGDAALVAGFSMPLQIYDRNQGRIREAELRREQSDAGKEAALVRARAVLYGLYRELTATRARFETLRSEALPFAQQALEQTQYGYGRGRFSYLELATAQQELLGLRVAVIDAASDFHRVLAEIERLTGEPLARDRNQQDTP